ncbi:MAG TPA: Uma2 family endonuclease [Solirubrobacteraceae bacterium]|jgi:Uma2 family endonuclease|nr:Uma2 family endonuclease [Solirubrobacteraceae bacterium]
MRTLLPDPPPAEVKALLERRTSLGLDRKDEVWEGVLHVVPAPSHRHASLAQQLAVILDGPARRAGLEPTMAEFNLGDCEDDFRVPDGGLHRPGAAEMWHPTAALVVEIVSPGDETWQKLPFYAAHHVEEVLIVDPDTRRAHWLALIGDRYSPIERSGLIELGPADLAQRIDWA